MTNPPEAKKWHFVNHRGLKQGPVREKDLPWAVEHGYLTRSSLVWTSGQPDWVPAEQVLPSALFDGVELPPPLPEEREALALEPEEISPPNPPEEDFTDGHQLLFKWVKNFDTNVRVFPARAVRAGMNITKHRKVSKSTDVFEGDVQLGASRTKVQVVFGIRPVVGGIMKLNVPRQAVSSDDVKRLTRDADAWFKRHWSGEERIPWILVMAGVCAVPVVIAVILLIEALGPGRAEAASACRSHLSAYIPVTTLDEFDIDRALFRPVDWHANQARSVGGQPLKCVVMPKTGKFSFLGACDWIGNTGSPSQTEHLSCLVYYDQAEHRWKVRP